LKLIKPDICIVGCGTLGGILASLLASDSKRMGLGFLYLIDYDIISENTNEPYKMLDLFHGKPKDPVSFSKVYTLANRLKKYKQRVIPIHEKYPSCFKNRKYPKGMVYIDCRDTKASNKLFKIKANFDGEFFKIILNPKTSRGGISPYVLSNSYITATRASLHIISLLTDLDSMTNDTYREISGKGDDIFINDDRGHCDSGSMFINDDERINCTIR
jgi:hypothetical protein